MLEKGGENVFFFSKNTRLKNQVAIHTSNSGDEANEYADMDRIGTEGELIWSPKVRKLFHL